jgi:hypothetical protein
MVVSGAFLHTTVAVSFALLPAIVSALTFDEADKNHDGFLDRSEFTTEVDPLLNSGFLGGLFSSKSPAGSAVADPNDLSFVGGFLNSLAMIIATELGDKTFFIAAILAMRSARAPVFLGAIGALVVMTILSAFLGVALPALMDRKCVKRSDPSEAKRSEG